MAYNRLEDYFYDDEEPRGGISHLFVVAANEEDHHKRVTTSEEFTIFGGSESTHLQITDTLIRAFAELRDQGKDLVDTDPEELAEIISKYLN